MADEMDDFDRWCFAAKDERITHDDGKPMPLLSTVLYRVCENNAARFDEAVMALRRAFEAGRASTQSVQSDSAE